VAAGVADDFREAGGVGLLLDPARREDPEPAVAADLAAREQSSSICSSAACGQPSIT
jgi:hypothetical protein